MVRWIGSGAVLPPAVASAVYDSGKERLIVATGSIAHAFQGSFRLGSTPDFLASFQASCSVDAEGQLPRHRDRYNSMIEVP
jgi:hypothetical protein